MNQKLSFILSGLLILCGISGCAAQAKSQEASYISMEHARAAALAAAGISDGSANITATELSERDGIPYYEVNFTTSTSAYSYSIDAVTGVVIEAKNEPASNSATLVTDYDTANPAPAADAPVKTDHDAAGPDSSDRKAVNNQTTPSAPSAPSAQTPSVEASKEITLEQAKQVALAHAGKSGTNATFVKAHKDFDDEQYTYELEFFVQSGNSYQEYDYEISAATGKVLNFDYDAESYTPEKQYSAAKSKDEVQSIALAKVPGASASDCSLWPDEDDGRLLYEGMIFYNGMKYEFEIDAYSGTILDWEAESIYD